MHITEENAKVEVVGKVTSITTEAVNTQISGNGQVVNVDVQAGADNTSIETPNTEIAVDEGVSGVTGAGQQEIAEGTTVRNNAEGTGIITPEPTPPADEDEDDDETILLKLLFQ